MNLSLQVLDCGYGVPAADVDVVLRYQVETEWREAAKGRTGVDGRLSAWSGGPIETGLYRLVCDLDGYYAILGTIPLHPRAVVEFRVSDPDADLGLMLMVTPNSYLTCRSGS